MSDNLKYLYSFIIFLICFSIFEVIYFKNHSYDYKTKIKVTKLLTMPDLSVCSEAFYIRHRSLITVGDAFSLSPSLLAYFPSDFVYSPMRKP